MLEKAGITMNDIDKIKIAGVFGKFIHASSAISFGLLPSYPDKIEFIGNAAGNGAARALFDADFVKNTEKLTEEIRHIELADENDFQNKFLNAMELKEWYYR
ncbi:ferredoxin [Clostridium sp. CAG:253]|nr:ferredoxin [Clostridium sp. CAG:253]